MKKQLFIIAATLLSFTGMSKVNPGEIIIIGMEESTGGSAVKELWFIALAPIDAGEVIRITDGSFGTTSPFALTMSGKDSHLSFTVGSNGLNVGDTWIIGDLNTATPTLTVSRSSVGTSDITSITSNGAWDLEFGTNGDDLWIYQGPSGTSANRFVYAVGCGTSGSQLNPATTGVSADIVTWGLTEGLTANYFNFGNSNYKLLGVNPNSVDFSGSIDDILIALGNSANYVTDDALTLNSTGSTDLSISGATPQPSNRYYDDITGKWYTDTDFTTEAIDPNRTHTVVVITSSFTQASGDTLDVAGIVVGDGSSSITVTLESGSVTQTVYGLEVTNNGTFNLEGGAELSLGTDFDVNSGGTANMEPASNVDFEGNLIVNGTLTLNASSAGFSTLGYTGSSAQSITGSGTINAEMYFANSGWHHLSAPGAIPFKKVSFTNDMALTFSGANRNVYRWDPSRSGWFYTQSTSNFGDSAFAVYFHADNVPTTATLSYYADSMDFDISSDSHDHTIKFHTPAANPVNSSLGWSTGDPADNAGWNLMKNPYWSHISWQVIDDALPSNVNASLFSWNPGNGSYDTWINGNGGTEYDIVPLLAYFNQANNVAADGTSFNRGKSAVFDGSRTLWLKTANNIKPQAAIYVSVNGKETKTSLMFDDQSSSQYEGQYDAIYRGVNPDVSTFALVSSDSVALAIDQRPYPYSTEDIHLTFDNATDGAQGEIFIDNTYLPRGIEMYLEDLHNGMITDLNLSSYTFTHDANASRQRFILHLTNNAVSISEFEKTDALLAYRSNGNMVLRSDIENGDYSVQVIDLMGRVVLNTPVTFTDGEASFIVPANGPYVVQLRTSNEILTVKTF